MQPFSLVQAQDEDVKKPVITELSSIKRSGTATLVIGFGSGSGTVSLATNEQKAVAGGHFWLAYLWDQQDRTVEWFGRISGLLDTNLNQMVRQTYDIGGYFYLLGAKPYWVRQYSHLGSRVSGNSLGLGVVSALRSESYNITPVTKGSVQVTGATFNIATGIFARYALSSGYTLGFQLMVPLQSFASSSERINASVTEMGLFMSSLL
ncbi:MAG: hypothetical protein OXT67_07830 [Zetaproteobacteria bacterium]|nr:hypothetical protein [Zetaproteobacteria bacterium]